jgi:hypothetical protein
MNQAKRLYFFIFLIGFFCHLLRAVFVL